jgi:surface protein
MFENDAPSFQSDGNLNVYENQTFVYEFNATDPNGDYLTYSILYGDDAAVFDLNGSTGVLHFISPRDFENLEDKNADNVYELTASVSDGSKQSVLNLYVRVTDVNETNGTGTGSGGKGEAGDKQSLTDSNFQAAISLWFSAEANATAKYGHIEDWNVSAVTDMRSVFQGRANFNENIGNWDVSKVTNMKLMFQGATSFNQPISHWDTSNVKNMWSMFNGASSFNQPIGDWNTSSVEVSAAMFGDATSFDQDISSWDLSNVTNLNAMFNGASSFNQDINNWDISNATRFTYMFYDASAFNFNISSWNIHPDANMSFMFYNNQDLSNANKGLIHSTFSTNSTWPYDWSAFVEGGGSTDDGGDHNKTEPQDPGGDDQNTTDPYNPGGDHNTTGPGSDTNDTHPFSIPVFELKVSDLAELTGMEGIKTGGSFALTELYEPADPQKTFFQLEEALFDQNIKEWLFAYDDRIFPLLPQYSDYQKLDQFLHDNQLLPVGHIYLDEHNGSDPYDPSKDQNGTEPHEPGWDDHNKTDPYGPGYGDHNSSDKPYEPLVNPPIVQTRRAEILDNGAVRFHGRILFDGGAPIMEAGIFLEDEYSGKIEHLLLDPKKLDQRDFTITTNQLVPGTKYHYFTFAQNEGGESRGVGLTLRTPAYTDEKALIAGAKPVEGGWLESDWFGTFKTFENGWTYHDALGWVFISEEQKDGLWMWRETNGWLWTDYHTWPFLWQHDLANWLYLFPSRSGRDPIFYDYGYSKYRE